MTKDNSQERGFICPCGKAYRCNTSLYTHVKIKHNGVAPGTVIRPERTRTRRIRKDSGMKNVPGQVGVKRRVRGVLAEDSWKRIDKQDEQQALQRKGFIKNERATVSQQIAALLQNFKAATFGPSLILTAGTKTCQDVASIFHRKFSTLGHNISLGLSFFFAELERAVKFKFGQGFWARGQPDEIIDVANLACQLHEEDSPIGRNLLMRLLGVFFRWMYDEKWTDDQIQKKLQYVPQK